MQCPKCGHFMQSTDTTCFHCFHHIDTRMLAGQQGAGYGQLPPPGRTLPKAIAYLVLVPAAIVVCVPVLYWVTRQSDSSLGSSGYPDNFKQYQLDKAAPALPFAAPDSGLSWQDRQALDKLEQQQRDSWHDGLTPAPIPPDQWHQGVMPTPGGW